MSVLFYSGQQLQRLIRDRRSCKTGQAMWLGSLRLLRTGLE
jgi:hypothetical protein